MSRAVVLEYVDVLRAARAFYEALQVPRRVVEQVEECLADLRSRCLASQIPRPVFDLLPPKSLAFLGLLLGLLFAAAHAFFGVYLKLPKAVVSEYSADPPTWRLCTCPRADGKIGG